MMKVNEEDAIKGIGPINIFSIEFYDLSHFALMSRFIFTKRTNFQSLEAINSYN
jgi:hypothetical protein